LTTASDSVGRRFAQPSWGDTGAVAALVLGHLK
jgi:hypothetical protein